MRIVKPSYEIVYFEPEKDILCIERAARLCYKSESAIKDGSAEKIIRFLIEHEHEAMLEHSRLSVIFTVDRGVSHELVRHRLASFAQESTRYCNYSNDKFGNEITVVEPIFFKDIPEERKETIRNLMDGKIDTVPEGFDIQEIDKRYANWYTDCELAESGYFKQLELGAAPQEARAVLPNSLKTEIMVTANYREWRKIFELRTAMDAHPEIRSIMISLLSEVQKKAPVIFYDISYNS